MPSLPVRPVTNRETQIKINSVISPRGEWLFISLPFLFSSLISQPSNCSLALVGLVGARGASPAEASQQQRANLIKAEKFLHFTADLLTTFINSVSVLFRKGSANT